MTETTQECDLRQEWETPTAANTAHWEHPCPFFDVVDAEFDFVLDAAATEENAKCPHYLAPEDDALYSSVRWVPEVPDYALGNVWLNPGFSGVTPWMEKAYREAGMFNISVVVMARISPSAKWWRNWALRSSEIRLLTNGSRPDMPSRIQFVPPPGVKASTNAQENCLIIFRPNPHGLGPRIWTWDWTEGLIDARPN